MSRRKFRFCVRIGILWIASFLLISPLYAHHVTQFQYVWRQVGKTIVDGYRITLIAKPPERTVDPKSPARKSGPADIHKNLSRYTHHFQVFVEDVRLREPVPMLAVTLSARMQGGSKEDFTLQPRFGERGFHYGGNVRLTRRGGYDIFVVLSPHGVSLSGDSKRRDEYFRTREAKFEFEYGYQGLKELMGDLYKGFTKLSEDVFGMELPDPAEKEAVDAAAEKAKRLAKLAGMISNLRFGAAQNRFEGLAGKLEDRTEKLAASLGRGDLNSAVKTLPEIWLACGSCHKIFREGEFAGK